MRIFSPAGGGLTQIGSDHPACEDSPVDLAAGNFDGLGKADLAVTCLAALVRRARQRPRFAPLPGPNHTAANPEPVFDIVGPPGIPKSLLSWRSPT